MADRVNTEVRPPMQLIVDAPPISSLRERTRASTEDARECFGSPGRGDQAAPREITELAPGDLRRWKLDAASSQQIWMASGPLRG